MMDCTDSLVSSGESAKETLIGIIPSKLMFFNAVQPAKPETIFISFSENTTLSTVSRLAE
jgi:hypothetical protein